VIRHRLKAIQKHIKNELGNREKNTKNAHFVLKKCTFRFRDYSNLVLDVSSVFCCKGTLYIIHVFYKKRTLICKKRTVLHLFYRNCIIR
jgi:hypothetical protein